MVTLDSFLNSVIPIGIVVFFGGILYSRLKTEIHQFIDWVKSLFENTVESIPEARPEIMYDY